jgi:hypothetical protein
MTVEGVADAVTITAGFAVIDTAFDVVLHPAPLEIATV